MKITKTRLQQFINEALQEEGIKIQFQEKSYGKKSYKRDEGDYEESPKEELGSEAHACVAEQTDIILGDLKKVLEKWEEGEYDSDEERWQAYAKDIQGVVDEYEASDAIEFGHSKEKCDEVHADQSHEEWEKEEKSEKPKKSKEKEEKKEKPSSEKKSPSGSKAKGPKLPPMTYESKLIDAVFGKLVSILPLKEQTACPADDRLIDAEKGLTDLLHKYKYATDLPSYEATEAMRTVITELSSIRNEISYSFADCKVASAKLSAAHKGLSVLIDRYKDATGELEQVMGWIYSIRNDMSPSGGTAP